MESLLTLQNTAPFHTYFPLLVRIAKVQAC